MWLQATEIARDEEVGAVSMNLQCNRADERGDEPDRR